MADEDLCQSFLNSFFERFGLGEKDKSECHALIEALYSGQDVFSIPEGYCSITFSVGDDIIIQFRPPAYALDLRAASAVRQVFGSLTPYTTYITTLRSGLLAYQMSRIGGISLAGFRKICTQMTESTSSQVKSTLVKQLAAILSQSWHKGRVEDLPLGLVGKSLVSRLKSLATDLPLRFQGRAKYILRNVHRIEALPWVLTHGDITANNIMVDSATGSLTGLIDWAEAERLPFGICLYGLEEILGEMTEAGFRCYRDVDTLRGLFWTELVKNVPAFKEKEVLETVMLARDLGVLLWHGIAWNDGALDQVVQEGRDVEDVSKLDAFLNVQAAASGENFDGIIGGSAMAIAVTV